MKIRLSDFKGVIPKFNERNIPPGYAKRSLNARFDDRCISPINGKTLAHTFPLGVTSIVLHDGTWRGFTGAVDAAPGPVATDRLYLTGDGVPKMFVAGSGEYNLKLPPPPTAPNTATIGAVVLDGDNNANPPLQTIVFAYTYVTAFDEESAPSPLSANLEWQPGQNVSVTAIQTPAVGRNIDRIRIYRSQTSTLGVTDLYFVAELPVNQTSYVHDIEVAPLAEFITSRDYDVPPDELTGIVSFPNGIMAAFTGRSLRFCEPYIPHAWPLKYELTTDYDIVGLAVFGMTLCVLTTGTPYMVQGQTPDTMLMQQMEVNLPCVAAKSIVDLGYACAYASHRGLVVMSQAGPQVVTLPVYTRNQWVELQPETMTSAQIDGKYLFRTNTGVKILNLAGGDQPYEEEITLAAIDFFYDITSGLLYYLDPDGLNVRSFDDPSAPRAARAEWTSGTLQLDYPVSFGVGKIWATSLGGADFLRMSVYGDGNLVGETDTPFEVFRLTGDETYDKWYVEIETDMKVEAIVIAGSPSEIVQ